MADDKSKGQTGGGQQGGQKPDSFGVQETKTRDFERINTSSGSTIKKGQDSQQLTKGKEE